MSLDAIIGINAGGIIYTTTRSTLNKYPKCKLSKLEFNIGGLRDASNNHFIDRNGKLFEHILEFYRQGKTSIPQSPDLIEKLLIEADYFCFDEMKQALLEMKTDNTSNYTLPSCITLGYRGSFACGREGVNDLRFRKLGRILVAGQINACKEVFGDNLNDTRDPDIGNVYSSRFFLQHTNLEHAFDLLYKEGYQLITSCASGTSGNTRSSEVKVGNDSEENRWQHYNEFIFCREK